MSGKRRKPASSNKARKLFKPNEEEIREQKQGEIPAAGASVKRSHRNFAVASQDTDSGVIDLSKDDEFIDLTEEHDGSMLPVDIPAVSTLEDDEAMARRLAREWAELDSIDPTNKAEVGKGAYSDQDEDTMGPKISTSNIGKGSVQLDKHMVDPQDELLASQDMFILSRKCTKCGKDVPSPRNIVYFSTTIPPPSLLVLLHCVCGACGQSHCRGCFRALTCPRNCKGKKCTVINCCAEIRAIALFEVLGGLDRQYLGELLAAAETCKTPREHPSPVATVGPRGTGYSLSSVSDPRSKQVNAKATASSEQLRARWDNIAIKAMETITLLLPAPYSDSPAIYDLLPHHSIRSLIFMSFLPEVLRDLLVNDSVTDWTDRSEVYNTMLKLIRRMADSELTVMVLIDERLEKKKSVGLGDWMWRDGTIEWTLKPDTDEPLRVPSLFDQFRKLTKQCETFLSGASHLLESESGDHFEMAVKATSLCGDMVSAQQDLQRALAVMVPRLEGVPGKGKGRDANVDMEKLYCEKCEELAFKHTALYGLSDAGNLTYNSYFYAPQVQQTENSTRNPSARLHLIKELSVLSTSLPPGVWVRVDEIRNDVIKFMIAGPDNTPYEGGLFEFDAFIPLDYPTVSPKVNLRTTGSSTVRFNPNLYQDGKVCLSLLGTWSGRPEEQWTSKSTLLQVIVSIQSLILVEAPYFNEPGFGSVQLTSPASIGYNKEVSMQNVRWAMVDWMQEKHREGIWSEVIANHFSIRREKILACIRKWAEADDRIKNYFPIRSTYYGQHQPPPANTASRNLLEEFELGCELVQGWLRNSRTEDDVVL